MTPNRAAAALAAAYVCLALGFVFLNPPGYAPDEPAHAAYARYWAVSGELPVFEKSPYWPRYTAFHPPYYFALLRPVLAVTDGLPVDEQLRRLRLVSVLLHGLALWGIWLVARRFSPESAVAALALAALNPQFAFVGASVNNDALVDAAMAFAVLGALRIERGESGDAGAALWGAVLGLACGAKTSAVVPCALLWIYLSARRRLTPRRALWAALAAAAVAGPVLARNAALYGDPLAASAIYKTEPALAGFGGLPRWFVSSFESSWAVFGWMTVRVPWYYYAVLAVLTAAAVSGAAVRMSREGAPEGTGVLALTAGSAFLLGAWYGVTSLQAQGRYMFIGLAGALPLAGWGLDRWFSALPRPARAAVWAAGLAFAAALSFESFRRIAEVVTVVPGVHNFKGL